VPCISFCTEMSLITKRDGQLTVVVGCLFRFVELHVGDRDLYFPERFVFWHKR